MGVIAFRRRLHQTASTQGAWYAQCWARIKHGALIKALGTCAFMGAFFYAYFAIMHHPAFPVRTMPLTLLDQTLPFQALWIYPYVSLWLYTCLVPALSQSYAKALTFGGLMGGVCVVGLVVFYAYPTAVVFPSGASGSAWLNHPLLYQLQQVDAAGNAFPSLHVACALFSAVQLQAIFRAVAAPRGVRIASALWCAAIVYSTLAIKQHVVFDVLGGVVLAMLFVALQGAYSSKTPAQH